MGRMLVLDIGLVVVVAAASLLPLSRAVDSAPPAAGWRTGRATYYGASEEIVRAYDPSRGTGAFGVLAYGACGYTNLPGGELAFANNAVAAMADTDPDYPGSCGRCYEIRCKSGIVLGNDGNPIRIEYPDPSSTVAYYDGDYKRPDLSTINATVLDDYGRSYLGNPAADKGQVYTTCWNNKPHVFRISDQCPCIQVLAGTAPGVNPGGETRRQEWCCYGRANITHFDVAYWLFEEMAHPTSGVLMLEYRPVDCYTHQPVQRGFVSSTLYSSDANSGGIQAGWAWYPQQSSFAVLSASVPVPSGNSSTVNGQATCVTISPKGSQAYPGSLSIRSREAYKPGTPLPFNGKSALKFQIRSNSSSSSPWDSSTPLGQMQVPPLSILVAVSETGLYCSQLALGSNVTNNETLPTQQLGFGWYQFQVPLSEFDCWGGDKNTLDRIDWINNQERDANFCLTDVELI